MDTARLTIYRKWYTEKSTISEVVLDNEFFCYSLEDPVRKVGFKIHGDTAIPMGRYGLVKTWSPRYQKMMWLLKDVKNYSGVRIHSGNLPEHTLGCLLFGMRKGIDRIYESRLAIAAFEEMMDKEGITEISIIDTRATE